LQTTKVSLSIPFKKAKPTFMFFLDSNIYHILPGSLNQILGDAMLSSETPFGLPGSLGLGPSTPCPQTAVQVFSCAWWPLPSC
jgi:hypothetical protein